MKSLTEINEELNENGIRTGWGIGAATGYTIGTTAGQLAGGAIGAVVGSGVGAYKKIDYLLNLKVPEGIQFPRTYIKKYGEWLIDYMRKHPEVTHDNLRDKFIDKFKSKQGTNVQKLHDWYEFSIQYLADVITSPERRVDRSPSIVSHAAQGVRDYGTIGGAIVGTPATVAGGLAGAYVGGIWELAKVTVKLLTGAKGSVDQVTRAAWLMQWYEDHNSTNLQAGDARDEFLRRFTFGPGFNLKSSSTAPFSSSIERKAEKEAQWFHDWSDKIFKQWKGIQSSQRRADYRDHIKSRRARDARYAQAAKTAAKQEKWANKQGNRYQNEEIHVKSFDSIVAENIKTSDPINEEFEQLLEGNTQLKHARQWIIDQVEGSEKTHDQIKKEFLEKFGKSKGTYFDKIVKEIVD